ncbi:hypothetical protein M758_8G157300 [Ceratodon purpureus]|nr:hypothetical protein M758_8G157300 [Ceratodon purpureus]
MPIFVCSWCGGCVTGSRTWWDEYWHAVLCNEWDAVHYKFDALNSSLTGYVLEELKFLLERARVLPHCSATQATRCYTLVAWLPN